MKRLIALLVAVVSVLLVSAWSPTVDVQIPVVTTAVKFDDTGFDYYAKEYGYIHLLREGDVVIAQLNNVPDGGFKLSYDEITEPSDKDNGYSRGTLQTMVGIEKDMSGVTLTFRDTELNEAMTYFLDEFVALSFKPVEVVHTSNTLAFECGCTENADVHMRVVFTRTGEDVSVHISAM